MSGDYAFSAPEVRARFGPIAVPCTKITPPKEEVKREWVYYIGEQVPSAQTLGIYSASGGQLEMTSARFAKDVLPRVSKVGWSTFKFAVTITQRAPNVGVVYTVIWDDVTFGGTEEEAIEQGKEGALKVTLPVYTRVLYRSGSDGVLKCIARSTSGSGAPAPSPSVSEFAFSVGLSFG